MRLNDNIRYAFVQNVMNDVPQVDYDDLKLTYVQGRAAQYLPPAIKRIFEDKKLRYWLEATHHTLGVDGEGLFYGHYIGEDFTLNDEDIKVLRDLNRRSEEQSETFRTLKGRIKSIVAKCSSTQALLKVLPEFEKYLPKEALDSKNLPSTTNLVSDFMKAGWPKGVQA